ncbi:hypothetical protein KNP414_05886 [Paenibacillus mucilaginosus KNP414]|uniref:Uncharacterized protein n=1 Tax=Paenibacillus mucilaginosus (strain KNP414) TaxID=1036673 RepID=F8F9T1_PAEMK|nr:hypothetical protein KNP414_05886 [Paenibacillus mucilaginosus KNP414]
MGNEPFYMGVQTGKQTKVDHAQQPFREASSKIRLGYPLCRKTLYSEPSILAAGKTAGEEYRAGHRPAAAACRSGCSPAAAGRSPLGPPRPAVPLPVRRLRRPF